MFYSNATARYLNAEVFILRVKQEGRVVREVKPLNALLPGAALSGVG
jgi:hypothetical protein